MDRRTFLGVTGAGVVGGLLMPETASGSEPVSLDGMGMLVDTTECIGCRKCEFACAQEHELTDLPVEAYEDERVFESSRRMAADAYTVVNRYPNPADPKKPIHVKSQCMHCLDPACASACLVGALRREENGAVSYDAGKCMGCRYCMVACPFQVPAYEYDNALTPKVQKCSFCFERVASDGKIPACAEMCPPMCLTFGKRSELLQIAREKIAADPERYEDHVYGEHEVGGTSWLYLAGRPFQELGFLELGTAAPPRLSETIQHSIFKFGAIPAMLFGLLGATMWSLGSERELAMESAEESDDLS
ncbi:MAG: 4Fe-4S dicluster domain-containing protein [Bryobacteraceae bacterium]|nr:4Fe-4S dicluster domain-containing protein [Bryobacteraceae bacterium]